MTKKSIKRAAWFSLSWAFAMVALFAMAWIFDVPMGHINSWRFMGLYAVLFTFGPLCLACLYKGMDQR